VKVVQIDRDTRIAIRPATVDDQSFVASTFRHQIRINGDRIVNRVLDHPATRVLLAVEPDSPHVILGWLCFALLPGVRLLHFAYTRKPMRRRGLQRALVAAAWPTGRPSYVYTLDGEYTRPLLRTHVAQKLPLDEALA
jgi:GNAT superfamily N-acetyltransferase